MSAFKIIHTSDWHLGKKLFKSERTDEHKLFLDWLYSYIVENEINLLLIAGDLFDVPSPPNSAQKMLYDFIYKLGSIQNFETILITGNHDSSSLFEIPKAFFKQHNCSVYSRFEEDLSNLEHYITYQEKTIGIKLLPYFRNHELINHISSKEDQSIDQFFNHFFSTWENKNLDFKILMAHHGFGQYSASGSEHAIFLSGLEYFPLHWLENKFDYVALGHIHKKQKLLEKPLTIYPGSPIPLRFSEKNQKYISELSIETDNFKQKYIDIPVFKKLVQLKTCLDDYIDDIKEILNSINMNDPPIMLEVIIYFEKPKSGTADHIRSLLKGSNVELLSYIPSMATTDKKDLSYEQIKELDLNELFIKYYKHKFDSKEIPVNITRSFQTLLEEIKDENTKT